MPGTTRPGGTFTTGDLTLSRMGYGAMQLAGPRVFGPPADRDAAVAVLRTAVEFGVDHVDTADFYGPHVTNEIIREALAPPLGQPCRGGHALVLPAAVVELGADVRGGAAPVLGGDPQQLADHLGGDAEREAGHEVGGRAG